MKELVGGRPAQDQRGRLRRIEARRHAGQAVSPERAIGGIRPDHRHIGHPVTYLKAAHALAELIDLPEDIVAHHERRPAAHGLRIEAAPDQYVSVLQTRGEHADPHLAPAGRRQGSVSHIQPIGIAEAPDLNNPVARFSRGRIPGDSRSCARAGKAAKTCDSLRGRLDQRALASAWEQPSGSRDRGLPV